MVRGNFTDFLMSDLLYTFSSCLILKYCKSVLLQWNDFRVEIDRVLSIGVTMGLLATLLPLLSNVLTHYNVSNGSESVQSGAGICCSFKINGPKGSTVDYCHNHGQPKMTLGGYHY